MTGTYWTENWLEFSLNYIPFPVSDRTFQVGRAWARYSFSYRDGQGGEDLGRKAYQWTLTVPLYRGVDESLYPDRYVQLLAILEDPELRGEVEYIDGELGPFQCKVLDYSIRTPADRRDGVELQITLEELGFDASALANLTRPKVSSASDALLFATSVDQDVAFVDVPEVDKPEFSLTQAWRNLQDSLDQGALAADVVAARMDELYLVAEKFAGFSQKDELQRWSIYISTVNLLGAAEDIANESSRNENAGTRLVEFELAAEMSAYDIASTYHGDSGRAEEVIFNNPNSNPASYPRGAKVLLNDDAKAPGARSAASAAQPANGARSRASAA